MNISGFKFKLYRFKLKKLHLIPESAAVYCLILKSINGKKCIKYIGSTSNLRVRIAAHTALKDIREKASKSDVIYIAAYHSDTERKFIERWLIEKKKPFYNVRYYKNVLAVKNLNKIIVQKETDGSYHKFIIELQKAYERHVIDTNCHTYTVSLELGSNTDYTFNRLFNGERQIVPDEIILKLIKYLKLQGSITYDNGVKKYSLN